MHLRNSDLRSQAIPLPPRTPVAPTAQADDTLPRRPAKQVPASTATGGGGITRVARGANSVRGSRKAKNTKVLGTVTVNPSELAAKLALQGPCQCELTVTGTLSLRKLDTGKTVSWKLMLLRRYGRQGKVFYFESGRRCASGTHARFMPVLSVSLAFCCEYARLPTQDIPDALNGDTLPSTFV